MIRIVKDMATKVHFLSIPSEEFAKILTYPSLGYLSEITTKYTWTHFTGWKVAIMEEYPAEMLSQLIIHNINYQRSIVYLHQSESDF